MLLIKKIVFDEENVLKNIICIQGMILNTNMVLHFEAAFFLKNSLLIGIRSK